MSTFLPRKKFLKKSEGPFNLKGPWRGIGNEICLIRLRRLCAAQSVLGQLPGSNDRDKREDGGNDTWVHSVIWLHTMLSPFPQALTLVQNQAQSNSSTPTVSTLTVGTLTSQQF